MIITYLINLKKLLILASYQIDDTEHNIMFVETDIHQKKLRQP